MSLLHVGTSNEINRRNSSCQRVGGGLKTRQKKNMKSTRKGCRAQGQREQTAKLDSALEIKSPNDSVKLNLKTANGSRESAPSF